MTGVAVYSADSGAIDAFGRWRTSEPTSLFDSQMQYDTFTLLWNEKITNNSGSAAVVHLPNESSVNLTVGQNDTIIRQTKAYQRYQPGKSQYILMTFAGATPTVGVTQRIGYFDDRNGIFLEISGTALRFVRRTYVSGAAVDNVVAQADWKPDTLIGSRNNATNPSGYQLDVSKTQILVIDLEWLGVGRVRVGFVIDGQIIYCHYFKNANVLTSVYMTTANLPVRYEISSTISGIHSLKQICSQVISEGGFETERGIPISTGNGVTTISVTTRRPILSIRPRALFNSIVNRGQIRQAGVELFADDQNTFFELIYGGTLTGASWTNIDTTYSLVEKDVAATAITGGVRVGSGYAVAGVGIAGGKAQKDVLSKLPLALDIDGNHPTTPLTDSLSVVATSIPGSATDTAAELNWLEL